MKIVIPMAGLGSRFQIAGYKDLKPFIDVGGRPMVERVIRNIKLNEGDITLVMLAEVYQKYNKVIGQLKKIYGVKTTILSAPTEGTACTVIEAIKYSEDTELIIANCDQLIDIKFVEFINFARKENLDGCLLTFTEKQKSLKWSYAKLDQNNKYVIEVAEKKPISNIATVGIYYFKSSLQFIAATLKMIDANERVNNEFYTCPVYNYYIKKYPKVGIYNIEYAKMIGLGTPEDLNYFIKNQLPLIEKKF